MGGEGGREGERARRRDRQVGSVSGAWAVGATSMLQGQSVAPPRSRKATPRGESARHTVWLPSLPNPHSHPAPTLTQLRPPLSRSPLRSAARLSPG